MGKKVLVAMSGGVDSSASAVILKEQGWDVVGATMLLHDGYDPADAENVAGQLGIPFHVIDLREEFKEKIIDSFVSKYKMGLTPNPCVDCNRMIKFGLLWEKAKELGCDAMATGHYARIVCDSGSPEKEFTLRKARFLSKDQSYFLHVIPKDLLENIVFPLGDIIDKDETRRIAAEAGLAVASKGESQDICFVPDGDYVKVIRENDGAANRDIPGEFVNTDGEILGTHEGQYKYTIGQRKGLGVASPDGPLYVLEKDPHCNRVVLGKNDELFEKELSACDVNWLTEEQGEMIRCSARIRYRHQEQPCIIHTGTGKEGECKVLFDQPQRAVTPGQAVVFYDGDRVLGGGTIIPKPKVMTVE